MLSVVSNVSDDADSKHGESVDRVCGVDAPTTGVASGLVSGSVRWL